MYGNEKMRPVETISAMGRRDKGGGGELNCDIW
jgi:hypothetical protein